MSDFVLRPQRYSARYGARDPWLAGWLRAGVYLLWRAAFAAWRPALFIALAGSAAFFAWRAAEAAGPLIAPDRPSVSEQAERRLGDPEAWWAARLQSALEPGPGRGPDLSLADSLAPLLPELAGRERLARAILMEARPSARVVEAELRAAPTWRRKQIMEEALSARMGADPAMAPELVFAPDGVAGRLNRARALYGPALEAVEGWFADPAGRALLLGGVPGLEGAPPRAALYGDVRDVLVQGCALAEAASLRIGQCRVAFLPKPPADLLQAGFALAVAQSEGQARIGARLLKAAAALGEVDDAFMAQLVLGDDPALAREAALAAAMPLLGEAGDRYTRPVFSQEDARRAGLEFARTLGLDTEARARVFSHIADIRRHSGALAAVRTAGLISRERDAAALAELARAHGRGLLGLHEALGAGLLAEDPVAAPDWRRPPELVVRYLLLAAGLLTAAITLLAWVILAGWRRNRGAAPGLVERADGAVTRLILGRIS